MSVGYAALARTHVKSELLRIDHETWVRARDAAKAIDLVLTSLGVDPLMVAGPVVAA